MIPKLVLVLILPAQVGALSPGEKRQAVQPQDQTESVLPRVADVGERSQAEPPTAEDILRELQRQRPVNDIIPPASAARRAATAKSNVLWPEGWSLVNRTGSLARDGNWWTFAFDDSAEQLPIRMLPNVTLESLVRTSAGHQPPLRLTLSGEVTVFNNANYLLARVAMRATKLKPKPKSAPPPVATPKATDTPDQDAASGEASSAKDVFERLKALRPQQQMIVPAGEDRLAGGTSAQRSARGAAVLPDGSPLVHRPGRLIQAGAWWTFVPESDHPDRPETPMKLLPNLNLQLMAKATLNDSSGLVFIVSGEVTAFEGENYLLPRATMRRVDSGNLRP